MYESDEETAKREQVLRQLDQVMCLGSMVSGSNYIFISFIVLIAVYLVHISTKLYEEECNFVKHLAFQLVCVGGMPALYVSKCSEF